MDVRSVPCSRYHLCADHPGLVLQSCDSYLLFYLHLPLFNRSGLLQQPLLSDHHFLIHDDLHAPPSLLVPRCPFRESSPAKYSSSLLVMVDAVPMTLVYVYGAIAKMEPDWLSGKATQGLLDGPTRALSWNH